ncbi:MAG: class B sortase [Bacilli bacterium]|nr:class B sortase [Bacilli bacterium]
MKKWYYVLFSLCLIIFISSFGLIFAHQYKDQKLNMVALEGTINEDNNETNLKEKYYNFRNEYGNDDIIGSINIPGADINTLFVKTTNNTYYLNHTLKKEKSRIGAVFMDYRNTFEDKQINIYGHNSNKYDVAFKNLRMFLDKDFTKNNDLIYIENERGVTTYQIFSVKRTKDDEHMTLKTNDFIGHINKIREDALYDTNTKITESDDILILQTCLLDGTRDYLIISSRKLTNL